MADKIQTAYEASKNIYHELRQEVKNMKTDAGFQELVVKLCPL